MSLPRSPSKATARGANRACPVPCRRKVDAAEAGHAGDRRNGTGLAAWCLPNSYRDQGDPRQSLRAHLQRDPRWLAAQRSGHFEFVFTPTHGSWLNLVEGFFS